MVTGGCWGFIGPVPLPLWIRVEYYAIMVYMISSFINFVKNNLLDCFSLVILD